ncbi:hypothetical protein ECP02999174_5331 [Escherichia coli P0299917.4]|nr:hypothetical protein ECP02999174_5331 [Escherichia coli P0299917.4]
MAVEMMFWPACPVDDDYCFDAIMYTSVIDKKFEDEHGVYLHQVYKELCSTPELKKLLKKKAIKLIAFKYDIDLDSANKILMKNMLRRIEN